MNILKECQSFWWKWDLYLYQGPESVEYIDLEISDSDLLIGGILGSRIPDIFSRLSGHFCWKNISGLIFSKNMKIIVTNSPILKEMVHNRAQQFIIVHYFGIETVLIDRNYNMDNLELKIGSRTFILLLEALLRLNWAVCVMVSNLLGIHYKFKYN